MPHQPHGSDSSGSAWQPYGSGQDPYSAQNPYSASDPYSAQDPYGRTSASEPPGHPSEPSGYVGHDFGQQGYGQDYGQAQGYGQPHGYAPQGYYPVQQGYPHAPFGIDPLTGLPYSDKTKLTAGLLGILLGGAGVGRFYTGHIGIGVAQLVVTIVTLGFGALWGLIDGIIMLAGNSRDAQGRPLRP
ncbi:NINE protein [Granulicoccus sp. GXG6511]|uniref:TM2 domain-containing protein n=1 Tax=Granulicoccus sp. GXG6511 TaxID=3381351 RepID=UPI003D7E7306